MNLTETYTSTGAKFFAHQQVMENLRNGEGQPITTHIMCTDICNHSCAFCSVQKRAGDSLVFQDITDYLTILKWYGLKSVILSGGGNPILYKCKETGANFNDVVDWIYRNGLEIGLITNGMPLRKFESQWSHNHNTMTFRDSWATVHPKTLDKLTWIRISMAGLDHAENEVYVPDIDPSKTTLGFSYVAHDIYNAPEDPHHGKVSTLQDLRIISNPHLTDKGIMAGRAVHLFEDRLAELIKQITNYVKAYNPRYVRLLPNCLEPNQIEDRCQVLRGMAYHINTVTNKDVVFVQYKPPRAPHACYLGYVHPVLNCDGFVYPCDSCVLNEAAEHSFANPWRICHWSEIAKIYEQPVRSLIADPGKTCPGCVFPKSNEILEGIKEGRIPLSIVETPEHANFV